MILLVILALLFSRIHIRIVYDGEGAPRVALSFLGIIRKPLYPLPKRTKKSKKRTKSKAEGQKKQSSTTKAKTSRLRSLRELRSLIASVLIRMPRTFTLKIKRFVLLVGSDDAAKTALLYGALSSSLSYFLEWLDRHLLTIRRSKRAPFIVDADFSSEEIVCDLHIVLTTSLFHLLRLACTTLLPHFLKKMMRKKHRRRAAKQLASKTLPDRKGEQ